jgi:long-chain acyl-CoA synthetase
VKGPGERNLIAAFAAQARRYGKRDALVSRSAGEWRALSWEGLASAWEETAAGLLALGVAEGDRVAILSENRPEWVMADLGCYAAGAVVVPLYWTSTPPQISFILADSATRAVFVGNSSHLARVLESASSLPALTAFICFDAPPPELACRPGVLSLEELRVRGRGHLAAARPRLAAAAEAMGDGTLATLVYTSGTTGEPKGVPLTHGNLLSNIRSCLGAIDILETDHCLSFLPLCHVFERTAGYYLMLLSGVTIHYAESIEKVPDNLREVAPTILISVPRIYEKMHDRVAESVRSQPAPRRLVVSLCFAIGRAASRRLQTGRPVPVWLRPLRGLADRLVFARLRAAFGGRTRLLISGGAALNPRLAGFFHAAGVLVQEGYGLTETSPVVAVNRADDFRFGTVGKPLPGVEVRIASDGEICVRGPSVMAGYYRRPPDEAVIDRGGWFHTGDIGHLDRDGFLHITDRKKDIIVTAGGKNIAPQAIEGALTADPFITQAFVFGEGRPFLAALVVPDWARVEKYLGRKGRPMSSRGELLRDPFVRAFLKRRIGLRLRRFSRVEQVRAFALLAAEFTMESGEITPTLKLRRSEIARRHAAELDALYPATPATLPTGSGPGDRA